MKKIVILTNTVISKIAVLWENIERFSLIKKIKREPMTKQFLKDVGFRTEILLYLGFAVNLIYSVLQLILSIIYHSLWAGALAVFNILLATIRFQLLNIKSKRKSERTITTEWRKYRTCGIILLCMTPFFASILILVVHKNSGSRYAGLTIYIMAIYTFFAVMLSIINVLKFRKHPSPILSAAMLVKLIVAFMSMLSLETAMLTSFDNTDNLVFRQGITGTTGGAVCLFVLVAAIRMVVQGTRKIKDR